MSAPVQLQAEIGETAAVTTFKRHKYSGDQDGEANELVKLLPPKKPRHVIEGTLELSELYSTVKDYTPNDIPQPVFDDSPSEDDIKYMRQAYQIAKKSPDESTQVGAVIINPNSGEVLGEGFNKMPAGCEDRFSWSKGVSDILKTKYPYVVHGVQAAILDAIKKKKSLEGATLYSTLIPDHKDSQMIREVGIEKVVYQEDKYFKYVFAIAAKKILEGLDCRQIEVPILDDVAKQDSDSD